MARAMVKCLYCEQMFDRNVESCIQINRRYAHTTCAAKQQEKDKIIQEIHEMMMQLCGDAYSKTKITRQINDYLKTGKTEIGILDTLKYWFEVKQEDPAQANGGIGIVEWVYGEAKDYYTRQRENAIRYKDVNLKELLEEKTEVYKITPTPIRKPKRLKLFDIH